MAQTLSLISWNVNGIRAAHRKGFMDWFKETSPDILCLQETRAEIPQIPTEITETAGYHTFWKHSKRKKGYSGTSLLSKIEPLSVEFGLGIEEFDQEGRTIIAHFPNFTLLNCYFPNGSRDHSRVPFKMAFYDAFLKKCESLRAEGKSVLFCGDVNTAHKEIDLANPQSNRNTTGFLPEERAWIDKITAMGYVDTFRQFHPDETGHYTWWSMRAGARKRNVGWRIDYFFSDPTLMPSITDAFILPDVTGSDHCPIGLKMDTNLL